MAAQVGLKLLDARLSHIHLERESPIVSFQEAELFQPRAGAYAHLVSGASGVDQERGGAARSIS